MRPTLCLLVLAPLLAGCVTAGDVGLTAKEAQGKADGRAAQWHTDAQLLGLGAAEYSAGANLSAPGMGFGMGFPALRDPHLGDGRALVWGLEYGSASANGTLQVLVFPNGTILADEHHGGHSKTVGAWSVDSPQASERALSNASFAAVAHAADAVLFMGLGREDSNVSDPVWGLFAFSQGQHAMARAFVGARTGELLDAGSFNQSFGSAPGGPTSFHFQGTVTPAQPTSSHPFNVTEGQTTIQAQLNLQGALPTDAATLDIRDPHDVALESSQGFGSGGSGQGMYMTRGPGQYVAIVTYQSQGAPAVPVAGVQSTSYQLTLQVR